DVVDRERWAACARDPVAVPRVRVGQFAGRLALGRRDPRRCFPALDQGGERVVVGHPAIPVVVAVDRLEVAAQFHVPRCLGVVDVDRRRAGVALFVLGGHWALLSCTTLLTSNGLSGAISTPCWRRNPSIAAQMIMVRYSTTESRLIDRRSSHHSPVV